MDVRISNTIVFLIINFHKTSWVQNIELVKRCTYHLFLQQGQKVCMNFFIKSSHPWKRTNIWNSHFFQSCPKKAIWQWKEVQKLFVAFCSFFSCSLTVVHRSRQRKSGGRQWKSSRADKHHSWAKFKIVLLRKPVRKFYYF